MAQILKKGPITLEIDLPSENYQGSRFDWTGKIVALRFNGKPLAGSEFTDTSLLRSCGRGFYNEFGMNSPLGYDQVKPGEWFHKIGVGLLQRDDQSYDFQRPYAIQPANFQVVAGPDQLTIICQSVHRDGYAYRLSKEIGLSASGFSLRYQLENQGEQPILTQEYTHNFLALDRALIGADYVLQFPFVLQTEAFEEMVNPEQLVSLERDTVRFRGTPTQPFFFSNLAGGAEVEAKWTLENHQTRLGITETGDFSTQLVNLWGWGHVISPELFISLEIAPGQRQQWSRTYELYEL